MSQKLECEKIFARLSEYLDEEIPADMADCISAHISGCEPCVHFLESLRNSVELCKRFRADEMPSPLANDIREQLRQSYKRMIALRRASTKLS
jgi:anti-sigma factor RsiW